ncbi:MAG: hypothetical protein F4227_08490 [Gammaproteobacteria bacterium]|nr:hypothetical protein [Gammaproteobacteria bacterium]
MTEIVNKQKIPIANVYYLFCYAWQHAEEKDLLRLAELDKLEAVHDLLGLLLAEGVFRLVRAGLDRGDLDKRVGLVGVRGKIDSSETMKRALRSKGRVCCEFQELSHDILHNRILRTTLKNLLRLPSLDGRIRSRVTQAYGKLAGVSSVNLSLRMFNQVHLDRNRRYYRMLLTVCRLIYEQLLIDEETGHHTFKELQDERMARLFERFVIEFYRREQNHFKVNRSRKIEWNHEGSQTKHLNKLPGMEADVILEGSDRRIILDAKYYLEALSEWYETKKLQSAHLYQLTAYLRNREATRPADSAHEGILLYPTVSDPVSVDLWLEGFSIKARSIDLAQDWREIHRSMLQLLD